MVSPVPVPVTNAQQLYPAWLSLEDCCVLQDPDSLEDLRSRRIRNLLLDCAVRANVDH